MIDYRKAFAVTAMIAGAPDSAQAGDQEAIREVLVMLSSDSRQTQGMAMVLAKTQAQRWAKVNVLLCDQAGGLALKSRAARVLEPRIVLMLRAAERASMAGAGSNPTCTSSGTATRPLPTRSPGHSPAKDERTQRKQFGDTAASCAANHA